MKRLPMCRGVLLASALLAASLAQTNAAQAANTRPATPSFSCWWTEPFVGFDISPGGAVYSSSESLNPNRTPMTRVRVVKAGSGWNVTGDGGDGGVTVKITKEEGSDGMSNYTTQYAGLLNGQWFGACLKYGNGTTPHDVIGVAKDDELNVRSSPSASARIFATIDSTGTAWVYPGKAKNGWLKVSARKVPSAESGRVTAVDGWVNGAFINK